jgi:Tat protein secretion system quality control protein TatD with DNase activity
VAELKGLPLEELASIAARNAKELFGLEVSLL